MPRLKVVMYLDVSEKSPAVVKDKIKKLVDRLMDSSAYITHRPERLLSITVTPDLNTVGTKL